MQIYDKNPNYSVDEIGRIFSHLTNIYLKPGLDKYGYPIVVLCNAGKTKTTRVHRMVAETFIPNPENKPDVNHKNGIKHDNRVENLEWVTPKQNADHAIDVLGFKPYKRKSGKLNSVYTKRASRKPISGEEHFAFKGYYIHNGQLYSSLKALAIVLGVSRQCIYSRVKAGKIQFQPKLPT